MPRYGEKAAIRCNKLVLIDFAHSKKNCLCVNVALSGSPAAVAVAASASAATGVQLACSCFAGGEKSARPVLEWFRNVLEGSGGSK